MFVSRPSVLAAAAAVFAAVPCARAAAPAIDHAEIKCLVVGKYRKMPAKFTPADVAQPRVYFRPEGVPSWYYVEMKPEDPLGHVGVLPKPTKALLRKHIEYYVEAASKEFDSGRTPEYAPIVVAKDGDCDRNLLPPLYAKNPPSAVFPSLPQGFAAGGAAVGAGTLAAVVGGGAAAAGGVILATQDDDGDGPQGPGSTTTSTTSTTPSTVPATTTTTLPVGRFLACQADVREGPAPLTVKFNAQAPGVFDYFWDFGDGGTSTQVNPSHTFTVPGTYDVVVRASNGSLVDTCTRRVTVFPAAFDLGVAVTGPGTVTAPGVACPGDCGETYASGTIVTLTAAPTGAGATFAGWAGDCSGAAPTCSVTMDQARSVTARFQTTAPTTVPLTVLYAGTGNGTVGGLACTAPCTANYPIGTPVTLTAIGTGGSTFAGWSGACTGTGACSLVLTGPTTVTVTFTAPLTFPLNVSVAGTGVVTGTGINCPGDCTEVYPAGTPVALTAVPGGSSIVGWGGDCTGTSGPVCNLVMSAARNVTTTFTPPAPVTLTVSVGGAGTGTITGTGINCPGDCTEPFAVGSPVTLTATATGGSSFGGWTGDCAGATGPTCNLTMTVDRTAGANFNAGPLVPLTVLLAGTGSGTVSGQGCTAPCTQNFPVGTPVTLTAMPNAGSVFTGWTGACPFAGSCSLVMNTPQTVTATFDLATILTLTVTGPSAASTQVVAFPPAQTCTGTPAGNTCMVPFTPGATATLVPSGLGVVANWGGACTGTAQGANCVLVMSTNQTADATFVAAPLTDPARAGSSVQSRLEAAGARLAATLNDAPLAPPPPGASTWTVAPRAGDNRLDAVVQAAGGAGTWRLELAGVAGLEKGTLRVLAGEAVSVGPDAVVFRLKGKAGERFSLAFTVR